MLIKFDGATFDSDSATYEPRGPILVNPDHIDAAYDHTILIQGHKIRVMDDLEHILAKLEVTHG